jgi:hypothetical protein
MGSATTPTPTNPANQPIMDTPNKTDIQVQFPEIWILE